LYVILCGICYCIVLYCTVFYCAVLQGSAMSPGINPFAVNNNNNNNNNYNSVACIGIRSGLGPTKNVKYEVPISICRTALVWQYMIRSVV
jgi:hypothetical protein